MKFVINIVVLFNYFYFLTAQLKDFTLEDVVEKGVFRARGVKGFEFSADDRTYTRLEGNKIVRYEVLDNKLRGTAFNSEEQAPELNGKLESYHFSPSEKLIMFSTNVESIYRHSTREEVFVYDLVNHRLMRIFPQGKIMYATISPSEKHVAFVYENNLFTQDLQSGKIKQITKDGKKNEIINGASDWVYEEEFTLTRSFEWSPSGDQIAFIRFDESRVKEYSMDYYHDNAYPEVYTFKYPKVGEENSRLSVWNYTLKKGKLKMLNTGIGMNDNIYIPRIKWTSNNEEFCVTWMNRDQNNLKLILVNTKKNSNRILFEEKSKYYVDLHDNLKFTKDGRFFYWTSETDGYNQLYRYDMQGHLVNQITKGENEITEVYGSNRDEDIIYFQRSEQHGLDRKIYSIHADGTQLKCITKEPGVHNAKMSSGAVYFVISSSSISEPTTHRLCLNTGGTMRMLEENKDLRRKLSEYNISPVELSTIKNSHGDEMNCLMIKPKQFDASKKYPVLMFLYGGPGSQQVMNRWSTISLYWWHQMIAQKGYIIYVVDNRGTGGKGEYFKKMTYKQLGKYETEDQIDAAKYLATLSYVDGSRIGIFGWSYGGYMSSLCLLKGNDIFKSAIAVAPVTNWKWYDSIYTERYMGDENNNGESYKANSPVYFADRLKGNYLLIHGLADDNVHYQNTAEMAKELIKHKKQYDTYVYTNRNHGISGDNATFHLLTKMTNFVLEKI